MMSRVSSAKSRLGLKLFVLTVKKNFGITVLFSIFMLLICPIYVLIEVNNCRLYSENLMHFDSRLDDLSLVITVLTCAMAVVCCLINFSFMYSKKSGDVYFALPVKRSELLFSRFFASLAPAIIPIFLCYGSMSLILLSRYVLGSFLHIIYAMLFNVFLVLLCAALSLLFIVCAGSIPDLLISILTVNIGALIIAFIFTLLCTDHLVGYSSRSEASILNYSSPVIYGFTKMINFVDYNEFKLEPSLFTDFIALAVIIGVSLALSLILFRKRKSEKCTCAYAYKGMYYLCGVIIGIISAFLLGILFGGGSERIVFWIFAAVGAALGVVTFGLITDRGFKTVKKSLCVAAASFVSLAAVVIILVTGGFGYKNRVPDIKDIESVKVEFLGVEAELKNPETVVKLHKKAILNNGDSPSVQVIEDTVDPETYTEFKESYTTYLRLEYNLKNGNIMHRKYSVKTKNCENELMAVYLTEENTEAIKKSVRSLTESISFSGHRNGSSDYTDVEIKYDEAVAIVDTYVKELSSKATPEILYHQGKFGEYNINGTSREDHNWLGIELFIGEDFTETIKLIEDFKLFERVE